jgi:ABC-type lipoprotein release transport system permease subunit
MIDNRKKILSSVFFVCIGAFMLFYSLKFGGTFFNGITKYILVPISLINIIGGLIIGFVRISNVKEINSEKDNSGKEEIVSCERNVKEINSEKDNNIIEAANDNEAKESKHVITAEISIEVTGEDEPTKYDKRRERWAVICFWALLAYIISALFLIFVDINVYFCFAFVISTSVCIFSFFKASYIDPEEPTGPMPWYYGAL